MRSAITAIAELLVTKDRERMSCPPERRRGTHEAIEPVDGQNTMLLRMAGAKTEQLQLLSQWQNTAVLCY